MCRKNLASLTATERAAFVNAVNELRDNGGYALFPEIHSGAMDHGHGGPAFFPWHRRYIRDFELALQAIDASVWLPYWDFTVDNLNGAGDESLIWRDDFMGGPGDPTDGFSLNTGPFAAWGLRRNAFDPFTAPGNGGIVMSAMGTSNYASFRSQIEGRPHGRAHTFVGGDAADFQFSPRDPVFWLIHCNVDRLWAEWIEDWAGTPGFAAFSPTTGAPTGHNLTDTMWPWNGTNAPFGLEPWVSAPVSVRPSDLLDHRDQGVAYDTIDSCSGGSLGIKPIKELKERLPKELKEFGPKELKEGGPKELKDRLPKEVKELGPKELGPKELGPKELGPKELGPKEGGPKEIGPKEIREDIFIPGDLRPDLTNVVFDREGQEDLLDVSNTLHERARIGRRAKRVRDTGKLREN